MLNQIKSTFTVTTPPSEASALVEAFARQEKQRLYPFELQNFNLGVRFQNADPQTQRGSSWRCFARLDQHCLSYSRQDQMHGKWGGKCEAFRTCSNSKSPFRKKM
jgi:hypothetical protein